MMVPGCFLLHEIATGAAGAGWGENDQGDQSVLGGNLANAQYGVCFIQMRFAVSVHHFLPWCDNAWHPVDAGLLPFPATFAAVLQSRR